MLFKKPEEEKWINGRITLKSSSRNIVDSAGLR
jgi:hypothetical protein